MTWIVRFVVAATAIFSAVAAFQITTVVDEATPPGTSRGFSVENVETDSKEAALDVIAEAANQFEANIFKVQAESGMGRTRVLFAFVGDDVRFESHGGYEYRAFSTAYLTTRVAPASEITTEDLRGRYVTSVEAAEMPEMLAFLAERGVTASDDTAGPASIIIYAVGQGNLAGIWAIVVLALTMAISYAVSQHRRIYALKALHGYRPITNLGTEVASVSRIYGVSAAGVLIAAVAFLGVYNHFHQLGRFLTVFAVTLLVSYAIAVVIVAAALLMLQGGSIPKVLKGERAAVRVGVLAAGVQVAVLAITAATTSAALNRIEAIDEALGSADEWTRHGDLFAVRVSGTTSLSADYDRLVPPFGEVIEDLESRGEVLLVDYYDDAAYAGEPFGPLGPSGSKAMTVNNEYLRRQEVLGVDGQRIMDLATGLGEFTLLVPDRYAEEADVLLETYTAHFGGACEAGSTAPEAPCVAHGTVVLMRSGQSASTYGGTGFQPAQMQGARAVTDPVIAVVAAESQLIDPLFYWAWASQDNVLFTDAASVDAALTEAGIRGSFQSIDNAADAVAASVALSQRQLQMDAFSIPFGIAVLLTALVVLVMVYCDRRARPMFVQYIHGYRFGSRHWRHLSSTLALALAGVAIAVVAGNTLTQGRDYAIAAGFILLPVAFTLGAVRFYEASFRAHLIKRD